MTQVASTNNSKHSYTWPTWSKKSYFPGPYVRCCSSEVGLPAALEKANLTARSSRLWKLMTARRPCRARASMAAGTA